MAALTFDDLDTAPPKAKGPVTFDHLDRTSAPPKDKFIPTKTLDTELDTTFGKGRWRDTGDYRSPARENQLRAQGAATVAPGRTSRHSLGAPDAPGAHDFVPTGDPNAALTKVRGLPGVRDAFYEGRSGTQGGHIHVDASQGPITFDHLDQPAAAPSKGPITFDHLDTPKTDPARDSAGHAKTPPKKQPGLLQQAGEAFADIPQEVQRQTTEARRKTKADFASDLAYERAHPNDVGRTITDPFKETGDILNQAAAPFVGAATSIIGRPVEKTTGVPREITGNVAAAALPFAGEAGDLAAISKLAKERGITEAAAKEILDRWHFSPKPTPEPEPAEPPVVGSEKDPVERVDNALHRLGGHTTAGRIEALQTLKKTPKHIRDPAVQEELTHAVEQKMVDPNAQIPEHLQEAEAIRQPWAERQRTAINNVRQQLAAKGMSDEEVEQYAPDTGYVPRRVVGESPGIDENVEGDRNPLGFGRRSLTKTTGSMKQRDQIVFENEAGQRTFEHRNPTNDEWRPGMTVRHPVTGEVGTVKQATIREIEGAGARDAKGQPLTYHKNALVNTIDEALKAERVNRNLQVLDTLTQSMKEQGLAHQDEWRFKGEDGIMNVVRANQPRPDGFVELSHIPQLRGWSFDPKIAEVLKDYYPHPDEPLDSVIATVNRALNASLFITPFPHIKNIATMGFIGRGWDWLPTYGNYSRLLRSGRQAIKEVSTLGPKYREHLKAGSGMMAGDEATRNFYDAMLQSAGKGIEQNADRIGKLSGLNPIDMVRGLYNVSHKVLWNVSDMILFQRQLELEDKGMSRSQAIKESERWIANYRIPPQVFKSRAFQQFIKNGDWVNFGRYTYGKWRAIGEMAKGLTSGDPKEQLNALGKVVAMGVLGLIVYPMLDAAAKFATGNQNAKVTRGGELAPIEAVSDLSTGEKNWAEAISSFFTPAPLLEHGMEIERNQDFFGQAIVDSNATDFGQGMEAAEYAGSLIYPVQLGEEATKPGGVPKALGRAVGVSLPQRAPGQEPGWAQRRDRKRAGRREAKDPIENFARSLAQ